MMLAQIDEIPRQLKAGVWKVTCLYKSGNSKTISFLGFHDALVKGWKPRLRASKNREIVEMYLSVMTDDGEQIFGTATASNQGAAA